MNVCVAALVLGYAGMPGLLAVAQGSAASSTVKQDKMFLKVATESGMLEVTYGKLAVERAYRPDVKALGQKMVDEHGALNEKLRPVAASHDVPMAARMTEPEQEEYDRLLGLSGLEFDREFLMMMVAFHGNDLHQYRRESAITTDPALKGMLPELTKEVMAEMDEVDRVAKANGVQIPGQPLLAMPATQQ